MKLTEKLLELQKSLEKAMLKTFEQMGEEAKGLSFFATIEEEEGAGMDTNTQGSRTMSNKETKWRCQV